MTGLRVTWCREWPRIFEEHPIPWSFDAQQLASGLCAYDAGGRQITNAAISGYVHTLRALYAYAIPLFGDVEYATRRDESQRIPSLLADYPTPWSFLAPSSPGIYTLDYLRRCNEQGRMLGFRIAASNGRMVCAYRTAAAKFYLVEAIFELSVMADDKYNRTTRGLW